MSGREECAARKYTLWTKSKVVQIDYHWEIRNFAMQVPEGWNNIEGPLIYASGTDVHWGLCMVPDSDGFLCVAAKQREYQAIGYGGATIRDVDSKLQICLDVCVRDINNTKVFCDTFTEVPRRLVTVGKLCRTKLIRRDIVLGDRQRFLPGGKLTVLCALHYLKPKVYTSCPVVPPSAIVSCMENMLAEGTFSDVVVVAEGLEFPVHQAILAERSEVFRRMFEVNVSERQNKRVVIEDFSADVVCDLLKFIYTDAAPNLATLAPDLLAAAEKYNIPRLKAQAEVELAKCLNVDNVTGWLLESEKYQAQQLNEAAWHFICEHAAELVETPSWKSLCEQRPEQTNKKFADYIEQLQLQHRL